MQAESVVEHCQSAKEGEVGSLRNVDKTDFLPPEMTPMDTNTAQGKHTITSGGNYFLDHTKSNIKIVNIIMEVNHIRSKLW